MSDFNPNLLQSEHVLSAQITANRLARSAAIRNDLCELNRNPMIGMMKDHLIEELCLTIMKIVPPEGES